MEVVSKPHRWLIHPAWIFLDASNDCWANRVLKKVFKKCWRDMCSINERLIVAKTSSGKDHICLLPISVTLVVKQPSLLSYLVNSNIISLSLKHVRHIMCVFLKTRVKLKKDAIIVSDKRILKNKNKLHFLCSFPEIWLYHSYWMSNNLPQLTITYKYPNIFSWTKTRQ